MALHAFIWFTGPFLIFLAVARFARSALAPPSHGEIIGVTALVAVIALVWVVVDDGWADVALAGGLAGLGALAGRSLGVALRRPSATD